MLMLFPRRRRSVRRVLTSNGGPHSNTSHFYIKHTIFGRLAGGMPTLSLLEDVPTGIDDRPNRTHAHRKSSVHWDAFEVPPLLTEK
ncbi:Peptidyl-prolyl cis-trans isomerase CYP65 [Diplonema papillatum]|nr:Peptidyl-prolyl cis-trans isomerase CYP65 [Diplonema papillatum]